MPMNRFGEELVQVFQALLQHFGPRKWWPAETPLEVIIGAILTQNVSWANVEKAIENLKCRGLLSVEALHKVDPRDLAGLIRPTRYYNQKTSRIKAFIRMLVEEFDGDLDRLFSLGTEELRQRLLKIKGIGKETADSICLYAACKPIFVVDSYTIRIFSRMGLIDQSATYDEVQRFFHENLKRDVYLFNEFHALIDALGHNICLARNPRCSECPVRELGFGCRIQP